MNVHIINNWTYKGWGNAKFFWWQGVNGFGRSFLVCIIFGIVFIIMGS